MFLIEGPCYSHYIAGLPLSCEGYPYIELLYSITLPFLGQILALIDLLNADPVSYIPPLIPCWLASSSSSQPFSCRTAVYFYLNSCVSKHTEAVHWDNLQKKKHVAIDRLKYLLIHPLFQKHYTFKPTSTAPTYQITNKAIALFTVRDTFQ